MLTKNLTNKVETLSAIRLVWLSGHKYPDASQPLVPPLVFFWGHLLQTDLWQWKHYLTLLLRIFNLVPCLDLTFIVHVNCWISTPNLSYFIYCYTISLPLKVLHFVIKTHSRAFSGILWKKKNLPFWTSVRSQVEQNVAIFFCSQCKRVNRATDT